MEGALQEGDDRMDRITRIETMEKKLNAALAAVHTLDHALEEYEGVRKDIRALEKYLSGRERRGDLAADEKGLLPSSLARGVLSEDGIYNLLEENDELLRRLKGYSGE